jgi:hypothetical protein
LKNFVKLAFCLVLLSGAVRMGFSRGDKVIPQVAAGQGIITKFDITNISPALGINLTNQRMRLAFYHNDGTSWDLQTSEGTGSSFYLELDPRQTLRVQATGGSTLETGYAVIYDEVEDNSEYSEDYVLGISVFYQISSGAGITENVSIPLREPTAAATVPIEINDAQGIYSAVAIVNTANVANTVTLALYNQLGGFYKTKSIVLAAKRQRTAFLDFDPDLFPELKSFKGMAEITADRPIVLLSLLQTRDANFNQQYTLLVPVDKEALRKNTYMVLLQADLGLPFMPLDIDGFTSDFYRVTDEKRPWDLEYRHVAGNPGNRFFRPMNHAEMVSLEIRSGGQFDDISLPDLKNLTTYSTNDIGISAQALEQTFAIRTDLGNYAKARIVRIIDTTGAEDGLPYQDFVLEVVIYK